jgi:hypothetical protein
MDGISDIDAATTKPETLVRSKGAISTGKINLSRWFCCLDSGSGKCLCIWRRESQVALFRHRGMAPAPTSVYRLELQIWIDDWPGV